MRARTGLTSIRPNYSAFKDGIIRSNPLVLWETAHCNGAHDKGSTRVGTFRWQAQKVAGSLEGKR
jgi:hypothetical protein